MHFFTQIFGNFIYFSYICALKLNKVNSKIKINNFDNWLKF